MDSVEEYARKWAKQEEVALSEWVKWVKSVKYHLKCRIYIWSVDQLTPNQNLLQIDDPILSGY